MVGEAFTGHPVESPALEALTAACGEVAAFGADLVVVSLGLDTYFDDPICDLAVTPDGFEACGRMVRDLALPTVVLQEGGYATEELGENARRWLEGVRPPGPGEGDPA